MPVDLKALEAKCRDIGRVIGHELDAHFGNRKVGFTLLLYDFSEGGHLTYLSNAERTSMIAAMREFIQNLETH